MATIKELLFFVSAVGVFIGVCKSMNMWAGKTQLSENAVLGLSGVLYIVLLLGLYVLFGIKDVACSGQGVVVLNGKEGFSPSLPVVPTGADEPMDGQALPENHPVNNVCRDNIPLTEYMMSGNVVSDEARCKGGEYMWQGDSATAARCRELASTGVGRCAIGKFNCPNSFIGRPQKLFEYTSQSNDQWKNTQCQEIGHNGEGDGIKKCTTCDMHYA